jgi:hypothetical protein
MRRLFPAFFITSLAMLVSIALVQAAATYNDTVSGAQTASPESEGAALNLNATGDLPGMFNIKLTHEGGNVNGKSDLGRCGSAAPGDMESFDQCDQVHPEGGQRPSQG